MNSQNILKFFGSKLDLKLDNSEFYDFELVGVGNDYDISLLDFTSPINYNSLVVDSNCLNEALNTYKPWVIEIDADYSQDDCEFNVRRRTEKGWTLDFVFGTSYLNFSDGKTFYYWGISGETESENYLDNNLSFSFTSGGTIQWQSYKYSGVCDTVSGYTTNDYIYSGQTPQLYTEEELINVFDINITITFERYSEYVDCEIPNEGGWNDLISGVTVLNAIETMTGATEEVSYVEVLNEKWFNERLKRLGTLKFYSNGKLIHKVENWEETIPSLRSSSNKIVQIWGGGTDYSGDIHSGTTDFNLLLVNYYEEPLNFLQINHNHITKIFPNFNIHESLTHCVSEYFSYTDIGLLTEDDENLLTEDNNILIY